MMTRYISLGLVLVSLLLYGCMTDNLGLQTQTGFSVSTTTTPPLLQVNNFLEFGLTISPIQPIPSSYRISYQNTDSSLPVEVRIENQRIKQGEWISVNSLRSTVAVKCEAVGQPKLYFYVKNQFSDLQLVEVSYTSAK